VWHVVLTCRDTRVRLRNPGPTLTHNHESERTDWGRKNSMTDEPVSVTCYSGRTYAERPISFVWRGRKYVVKQVEKEWLEPGERSFTVKTKDGSTFILSHDQRSDAWTVIEIES